MDERATPLSQGKHATDKTHSEYVINVRGVQGGGGSVKFRIGGWNGQQGSQLIQLIVELIKHSLLTHTHTHTQHFFVLYLQIDLYSIQRVDS